MVAAAVAAVEVVGEAEVRGLGREAAVERPELEVFGCCSGRRAG